DGAAGGNGVAADRAVDAAAGGWTPGVAALREPIRRLAQFALDNGFALPVLPSSQELFPAGRAATRGEMAVFLVLLHEALGG
ncbi:MAG: hypothetical protein LBJ10_02920, partial [Clostridiales bacterium]|nr:hypothetical protein [Clostridiales bacterium]